MFGLPLRILSKTRWEPYLTLQDFDTLKTAASFAIGTSMKFSRMTHLAGNELVLHGSQLNQADLIFNLNTNVLIWNDP